MPDEVGVIDPSKIEYIKVDAKSLHFNSDHAVSDLDIANSVNQVSSSEISQNPRLQAGILKAKSLISQWEKRLHIPEIDQSQMHVSVISVKDYVGNNDMPSISSVPEGYQEEVKDQVVVIDKGQPDYVKSAIAFHELIHRYLDRKIHVTATVTNKSGSSTEYTQERRAGLSIRKENQDTHEVSYIGDVPNELGNVLAQQKFAKSLLELPEYREEAATRNRQLETLRFDDEHPNLHIIRVNLPERGQLRILIDQDNIHFNAEGKPAYAYPMFITQLATDLEQLCDDLNSGLFEEVLFRSKVDPAQQNLLRQMIDNKMGRAFYSLIRNAPNTNLGVITLLERVQKVRYKQ